VTRHLLLTALSREVSKWLCKSVQPSPQQSFFICCHRHQTNFIFIFFQRHWSLISTLTSVYHCYWQWCDSSGSSRQSVVEEWEVVRCGVEKCSDANHPSLLRFSTWGTKTLLFHNSFPPCTNCWNPIWQPDCRQGFLSPVHTAATKLNWQLAEHVQNQFSPVLSRPCEQAFACIRTHGSRLY